ncbi:MAG TPA: sulfite exporter TauE/SafE family protein [Burkholderiales bacterium]
MEWWAWPIALFAVTFAMGIVAVLAGVGGGVLFVPIVSAFFPFHLDFVRAAGLLIALTSALSAAPSLLANGLASMRLAMPLALIGSVTSVIGALVGLALPTEAVQIALGATILGIATLMWRAGKSEHPHVPQPDALGAALGMHGVYHDPALGRDVAWQVHRTPAAFFVFGAIGVLAGMFGLGAGWANVPALNLLMGAPLKLAVGTSGFVLSVVDTSAAWIYLNRGAVLPMIVVPSLIGVMLGAKLGARLLRVAQASVVRKIVLTVLFVAGGRALLKGLGI